MPMIRKPTPLLATVRAASKELDGAQSKVGWFESGHYLNGTPVAYVAAIQEFGSEEQGIPARLPMRQTLAEKQSEWAQNMADGAIAVAHGQLTGDQVMEQIGAAAAGEVRKAIAGVFEPQLSDRTLGARRRRGNNSTKPLVDSGYLINTLTHSNERD